jgi:hypothetical protein
MKIELKAIKHSEFASEETNCYQANLYVDGKKIGIVGNDGHGGCDYAHADEGKREALQAVEAYCAALPIIVTDLPAHKGEEGNFSYPNSLESVCGDIVTNWLITRDVKKALRRCVCFTKPDTKGIFEFSGTKATPEMVAQIQAKHPTYIILNSMSVEEAVAKWMEAEAA